MFKSDSTRTLTLHLTTTRSLAEACLSRSSTDVSYHTLTKGSNIPYLFAVWFTSYEAEQILNTAD